MAIQRLLSTQKDVLTLPLKRDGSFVGKKDGEEKTISLEIWERVKAIKSVERH